MGGQRPRDRQRQKRGEGETEERRGEETGGWGRETGGQELWAKEQVQKGAFSTRDTEW